MILCLYTHVISRWVKSRTWVCFAANLIEVDNVFALLNTGDSCYTSRRRRGCTGIPLKASSDSGPSRRTWVMIFVMHTCAKWLVDLVTVCWERNECGEHTCHSTRAHTRLEWTVTSPHHMQGPRLTHARLSTHSGLAVHQQNKLMTAVKWTRTAPVFIPTHSQRCQ